MEKRKNNIIAHSIENLEAFVFYAVKHDGYFLGGKRENKDMAFAEWDNRIGKFYSEEEAYARIKSQKSWYTRNREWVVRPECGYEIVPIYRHGGVQSSLPVPVRECNNTLVTIWKHIKHGNYKIMENAKCTDTFKRDYKIHALIDDEVHVRAAGFLAERVIETENGENVVEILSSDGIAKHYTIEDLYREEFEKRLTERGDNIEKKFLLMNGKYGNLIGTYKTREEAEQRIAENYSPDFDIFERASLPKFEDSEWDNLRISCGRKFHAPAEQVFSLAS